MAEAKRNGKPPAWVEEFKFEGEQVTYDDIVAGRAPRPRVLDMFAGGGAIPLEALRLGCEAYALDLNPVAHIIQLCTLVYPQKYGKPDPSVRGMTGPKNDEGETTWGGLAEEVRYWGNWVLEKVKAEIGDLYPPIPDPEAQPEEIGAAAQGSFDFAGDGQQRLTTSGRYLTPVAYLWTRTVRCKNPNCGATVPLVKQTWLCKKEGRYVALKAMAPETQKRVRFLVVEARSQKALGFDPEDGSKGGNAICRFCGTVAESDYVKVEGNARRLGNQAMAFAAAPVARNGKLYYSADELPHLIPDDQKILQRIDSLCRISGLTVPTEPIINDAKGALFCVLYGVNTWGDIFTPRQTLCLLTLASAVQQAIAVMRTCGCPDSHCRAVVTYLAAMIDKLADFNSVQCTWNYTGGRGVGHSFTRQALGMTWDCAETNPFNDDAASWPKINEDTYAAITMLSLDGTVPPVVQRGSAVAAPWTSGSVDAVVTDPPYYDNVPYADISDFFYVWLKRTLRQVYPEHFATEGTPKKTEAVADAVRHGGDKHAANLAYETMMESAFREAARVLKPGGPLTVVYAHKTTLGWATLVEALRRAGFVVTEAWPLDTEMKARMRAMNSAALATSISLIARKRESAAGVGNFEDDVQPDLEQIVRERVDTLWDMGIAGADLVIACVGAGLRAFTKYDRVEYANGEEVPAEKFLAEVEGVVLDAMMGKLFGQSGSTISAIDPASRFYVLWRFIYKAVEIDAGEAIVFTYGLHVELDGATGLSAGKDALVEKKKAKYRARDFSERGDNPRLGLTDEREAGKPVPLINVLHRLVWLMEHSPRKIGEFLAEAQPDRERLRVLAQALAGAALKGKSEEDAARLVSTTPAEQAALAKLLANWRSVVEHAAVPKEERADRKAGQKRLEL